MNMYIYMYVAGGALIRPTLRGGLALGMPPDPKASKVYGESSKHRNL
jgi:hypothetical protein